MKQAILISVLMPVYNDEKYVSESISSILSQSYQNFELVIVNDGSTDNSQKIIHRFRDQRIKVFTLKKNKGIVSALNFGLKQCQGKYIARMDADDIAQPERLYTQLRYLEHHPKVVVCGSNIQTINMSGEIVSKPWWSKQSMTLNWTLVWENTLPHPSAMMRREIILKLKYRDFQYAEDYDLWLRALQYGAVARLDQALLLYRRHTGNNSAKDNTTSINSAYRSNLSWIHEYLKVNEPLEHRWLSSFSYYGENFDNLSPVRALSWMNELAQRVAALGLIQPSSFAAINDYNRKRLISAQDKLRFSAKINLIAKSFREGHPILATAFVLQAIKQYLRMLVR